jgi:RNA polymerase sigma factor (sigma-70 family)
LSRSDGGRPLTPEEFEALLRMLDPDREKAGELYESIRRKLIRLFECRGCAHSEDLADETFNRVARKCAEGLKIEREDPYAYFCGVAHRIFQEVVRRELRKKRAEESGDWPPSVQDEEEPDFRLEPLRQCLGTLESAQRRLLLRYYEDEQRIRSRKGLCDELRIPMNALRIRVHRLRRKVETCIEEKLRN